MEQKKPKLTLVVGVGTHCSAKNRSHNYEIEMPSPSSKVSLVHTQPTPTDSATEKDKIVPYMAKMCWAPIGSRKEQQNQTLILLIQSYSKFQQHDFLSFQRQNAVVS